MSLFSDLINTTQAALHSYTGTQEQSTYLTAPIASTDVSIAVASTDQMARGLVEIESELVYVDVADAGVLNVPPFGRGYRGSGANAHVINTQVLLDPAFPRIDTKRALTQAIQALFPTLYQIKTVDLTYSALPIGYNLPADCREVLEVKFQPVSDPYNYWTPVFDWSFDTNSPVTTGNSLNLFDNLTPGSTVRVVYMADFSTFTGTIGGAHDNATISNLYSSTWAEAEDLSTLGLNESWVDLLMYAVSAQMVRFLDPSRLALSTVENVSRAQVVQVGDAGKVANQLYALYQQRMQEERRKLLTMSPPSIHFQR